MHPSPPTRLCPIRAWNAKELVDAIADLTAARRYEVGLSQSDLEYSAGMPDGHIAKIEAGARGVGPLSLELVLGALGVQVEVRLVVPDGARIAAPLRRCGPASRPRKPSSLLALIDQAADMGAADACAVSNRSGCGPLRSGAKKSRETEPCL